MSIYRLALFLLLLPAALASAGEDVPLLLTGNPCGKSPTPDVRVECERLHKEKVAAYKKESKAKQKSAEAGGQKNRELCFTRKASGEVVCPN